MNSSQHIINMQLLISTKRISKDYKGKEKYCV